MAMTKQEIFDTVARHLFAQGEPAMDGNAACAYRAPKGLKCAVGALIADEHYSSNLDFPEAGHSITVVDKYRPVRIALHKSGVVTKSDIDHHSRSSRIALLSDLQVLHDNCPTGERNMRFLTPPLKSALKRIAAKHKLDPAVLEELK